ncbi:MAG: hypothetical protein AB1414_12165 [bacterium]
MDTAETQRNGEDMEINQITEKIIEAIIALHGHQNQIVNQS